MLLKIGLTGGIGSGKSVVARIFETIGIPVYYADDAARKLMNSSEKIKTAVIKNFGEQAYSNKELDRKYLAKIVFNNKKKLDLLNSIVHPVTISDAEQWMKKQKSPYIIKEAALLFESKAADNLDYVIGVYAPQHIRVKRVMQRDMLTSDEVMKRINHQLDEDQKMKLCDFIIKNNEVELIIPQVLELDKKFREIKLKS
jgi:dephospho-CoA kinase